MMPRNRRAVSLIASLVLLSIGTVWAVSRTGRQEKIDPALRDKLASLPSNSTVAVWVMFKDKGESPVSLTRAVEQAERYITDKAYERRRIALRSDRVSLYEDLPVNADYVREIENLGGRLRVESRWLNAASFLVPASQVERISELEPVKSISEVVTYRNVECRRPSSVNTLKSDEGPNTLQWDYGFSEEQLSMINAISVLQDGYTGEGANIGILDTGYRTSVLALKYVRKMAEHDFLSGDQVPFYRNSLAGTWDSLATMAQQVRLLENMTLAISEDGVIHAFWEADTIRDMNTSARDIYYSYSTNRGSWWNTPFRNISASAALSRRPCAVASDTLYLFWEDGIDTFNADGDQEIFMLKCWAGGFYGISNISNDPEWSTWPAAYLEPGSTDVVHLVWMNSDSTVMYSNSRSWSNVRNLTSPYAGRVSPASVVVDGMGYIHVVWSTRPDGVLIHARSTDAGVSFVKDTLRSAGSDDPVLAVSDSTVYLFFTDFSGGVLRRVMYARSTDGGSSWPAASPLSGDLSPFLGRVSASACGSRVVCAWENHRTVYVARSTDRGQTWPAPDSFPLSFSYDPVVCCADSDDYLTFKRRGDDNTDYEASQDGDRQHWHGTEMLSIMGGFRIGELIGPAFKANYYLAKTEKYVNIAGYPHFYEMPCEEDFWVEGLEWLEAQGVDVVSSSLGYPDLYEYYRRDGKTALISQAAYKAYKLGVLVVNAIGNARLEDTLNPGSLYPPSDADSIVAVGGVVADGTWLSPEKGAQLNFGFYSAQGPTSDGRTKPEVMAPVEAYMVNPAYSDSFWYGIGTSGATALTAGVAGLMLHAHPSWRGDAKKLRDCLLATATLSSTPTDTMGWGIVDAYQAIRCEPVEVIPPKAESLLAPYPNPVRGDRGYVTLRFYLFEPTLARIRIYTLSGELVWKWKSDGQLFVGEYNVDWDLKNESGNDVASGIYIVALLGFRSTSLQKLAVVR
jgi:hypothetical protein